MHVDVLFFLTSFLLFHFPTEAFTGFSSLVTSAVDLKLVTQHPEWSEFAFQHFFLEISSKITKLDPFKFSAHHPNL